MAVPPTEITDVSGWITKHFTKHFEEVRHLTHWLNGRLTLDVGHDRPAVQIWLEVPYPSCVLPETPA